MSTLTTDGVLHDDGTLITNNMTAQRAIFGYGNGSFGSPANYSMTNLVNNYGQVASDTTGVGTVRQGLAAASYGGDKAIFAYGTFEDTNNSTFNDISISSLVSNLGIVGSDITGVGTARRFLAAAGYGGDKAIFGYGNTGTTGATPQNMTNLVSNTGVVGSDITGVGTNRATLGCVNYGGDKAIFGFGVTFSPTTYYNLTNLVSNTGVVGSDVSTVATVRSVTAYASYGGDKGIFSSGLNSTSTGGVTNLVSNTGVIASDVAVPSGGAALNNVGAGYGGDKAIFAFGFGTNDKQYVTNTGVLGALSTGVGTARQRHAAASYSS